MEIIAAKKLVRINSANIILNLDPFPVFDWEIAETTRTKTKIGAIALRADTKMSPINPMNSHFGTKIPKMVPIINPMIIFRIRLDCVHFSIIFILETSFINFLILKIRLSFIHLYMILYNILYTINYFLNQVFNR